MDSALYKCRINTSMHAIIPGTGAGVLVAGGIVSAADRCSAQITKAKVLGIIFQGRCVHCKLAVGYIYIYNYSN